MIPIGHLNILLICSLNIPTFLSKKPLFAIYVIKKEAPEGGHPSRAKITSLRC
jgi:hypothetical protein